MRSVQFNNFTKVERNSQNREQKNQKTEDSFSDIMGQSLEQVHTDKEPEEEKKEDRPEGMILPSQIPVFPNQTPVSEEIVTLDAEQLQALTGTENLQTGSVQSDMTEQVVNPAGENLMDLAAMQTDGENLQMADAATESDKTTGPLLQQNPGLVTEGEKVEAKTEQKAPEEPQWVSEGMKAEVTDEIKSGQNASEKHSGEKTEENVAVRKDKKEEQTSLNEAAGSGDVLSQVSASHSRREAVTTGVAQVHVAQPEELPQRLAKELAIRAAAGQNGFEIQITPKHLGEITVRIMQEDGVSVVSIICSERKTMELLAQSARDIGSVMEQNLGRPTEIYVEKQENENPWQEQQENDHSGRESEQHRQKEQNEKMKTEKSARFLQELRLGLTR